MVGKPFLLSVVLIAAKFDSLDHLTYQCAANLLACDYFTGLRLFPKISYIWSASDGS